MDSAEQPGLLPGEALVQQGLADLGQHRTTDASLLLLIAAPRLRALGLQIPPAPVAQSFEHALYERLEERLGTAAHSYYNSLIRLIVSYARALEREKGAAR
jgi:hypothetical protein